MLTTVKSVTGSLIRFFYSSFCSIYSLSLILKSGRETRPIEGHFLTFKFTINSFHCFIHWRFLFKTPRKQQTLRRIFEALVLLFPVFYFTNLNSLSFQLNQGQILCLSPSILRSSLTWFKSNPKSFKMSIFTSLLFSSFAIVRSFFFKP